MCKAPRQGTTTSTTNRRPRRLRRQRKARTQSKRSCPGSDSVGELPKETARGRFSSAASPLSFRQAQRQGLEASELAGYVARNTRAHTRRLRLVDHEAQTSVSIGTKIQLRNLALTTTAFTRGIFIFISSPKSPSGQRLPPDASVDQRLQDDRDHDHEAEGELGVERVDAG